MKPFKFFWTTHKWTGILFSIFFASTAATGFLLLIKKEFAWLQPPTQKAEPLPSDGAFISTNKLLSIVFAQKHPDFRSIKDIDRVDFRPNKRIFKVRSEHNYSEMQVDAVSGAVLSVARRNSDLIEQIHDGSFFAGWFHDYFMPFVSFALLFLIFSGLWLWLEPKYHKWKRKRRTKNYSDSPPFTAGDVANPP